MHGTQLSPFGQGTVVVTNGLLDTEPLQVATLSFQGTGNEIHGTLGGRLSAGSATSKFVYYPQQQTYNLLLEIANLQLAKLHTLQQRNLNLSGRLNVNASGSGSIKNPALTLTAEIPTLQFQEQTIRGLKLQANVEQHLATLDLTSQAVNTGIRAHGTVGLTGDYQADVRVDTGLIPLEPLLDTYAPQAGDITGHTELHATLRGPLKHRALLEMHAQLPVFSLSYQNFEIAAVHPVLIDYAHGMLAIQRSEIRGTDTDLQFEGNIPVQSTEPASLLLLGTVDLNILRAFAPDLRSSGQLKFDINSIGQTSNPNFQGKIQIVNANLSMAGAPLGLQNGNGVLTLSNKRVDVTSFQGQMGGGTVTAHGGLVIRPGIIFDLAASGNGISLLYPRGVRSAIDGDLTLTGNAQTALLRGQIHLDRLSFTPDFDVSTFAQQFSNEVSSPPSAGFANNVQLQIVLQTGAGLNLVSRTLSLQGGANLRIQGTCGRPGRARPRRYHRRRCHLPGESVRHSGRQHCLRKSHTYRTGREYHRYHHHRSVQHQPATGRAVRPPANNVFVRPRPAARGHHQPAGIWQDHGGTSSQRQCRRFARTGVRARFWHQQPDRRQNPEARGHFAAQHRPGPWTKPGNARCANYRPATRNQQPVRDLFFRRNFDAATDNPAAISTESAMVNKHRPRPERRLRLRREGAQKLLNCGCTMKLGDVPTSEL